MIYGYIRVSTDKQQVDNQFFEIRQFAKEKNMKVERWVQERISSTKELDRRKLGDLLGKLKKGDILITCELSRLGRNLLQVMGILNFCMSRECQVWSIKENYRLGADIQSKVLAFAFGLSAEIERNLISQRTKEALARLRSEGKKLGRPVGRLNKKHKLFAKVLPIKYMLRAQVSKKDIAEILNVSISTLYRYMDTNQIDYRSYYKLSKKNRPSYYLRDENQKRPRFPIKRVIRVVSRGKRPRIYWDLDKMN